jgi:hypothetical protein
MIHEEHPVAGVPDRTRLREAAPAEYRKGGKPTKQQQAGVLADASRGDRILYNVIGAVVTLLRDGARRDGASLKASQGTNGVRSHFSL